MFFSVTASKSHRILTPEGWKTIEQLRPYIDAVVVQKFGKMEEDRLDPLRLKRIGGQWRSTWQNRMRKQLGAQQNQHCAECGRDEVELNIHHIVPVHINQALAFKESNIILVCVGCHQKHHELQGWQGGTYLYGASVLIDSIIPRGLRETYDLEIEGEFANFLANGIVVHNSRNASSSRAIPANKIIQQVIDEPAIPVTWGRNQKGMQADSAVSVQEAADAEKIWLETRDIAVNQARRLIDLGIHKQLVNRILEPWHHIQVVCTATEWANFFALRDHPMAEDNMQALAKAMKEAYTSSVPREVNGWNTDKQEWWHLPFISEREREFRFLKDLIVMSVARCARVSYMNHDGTESTLEQDYQLYDRLLGSHPIHASPAEHQAEEASSADEQSGNFRGWLQYRKRLSNENIVEMTETAVSESTT